MRAQGPGRIWFIASMKGLTQSQKNVLEYINRFLQVNGFAPTAQEIASEFQWGSKTAALDHLRALEKKKYILRSNGKARSIQVLPDPIAGAKKHSGSGSLTRPRTGQSSANDGEFGMPSNEFARPETSLFDIPVFGTIPAGSPQDRQQESEGCINVNLDYLGIRPTPRTFALEVRGDSMIDRHIVEGDVVVLEHGVTPRHGDVVAALIDGESTLKTFTEIKGKRFLKAENPAYPDLIPAEELVTQGVMVALIRKRP